VAKSQKIQKWGNSLAVRIPQVLAEQAGLAEGTSVFVRMDDGKLVISRERRKYRLDDLLDRITPENRPEVVDWGPPVGKEIW
jgi:antitoxin MazE